MANDMACELFGYADEDLLNEKLSKLVRVKRKEQESLEELDIDPATGNILKISGRIVSPHITTVETKLLLRAHLLHHIIWLTAHTVSNQP